MKIEITWRDLRSLHKAGALSRHLLEMWQGSHYSEKDDKINLLSTVSSMEYQKEFSAGVPLVLLIAWMAGVAVTVMWGVEFSYGWVLGGLCLTGLLVTPQVLFVSRNEYLVKKFAAELSLLCDHLGKTPAALAQMDEQALKNLATRFLRSAAGEVAKLDPKSTWSSQVEANKKMREDFRNLFDFFKSFGLTERSGYASYFPEVPESRSGFTATK